MNGEEGEGVEDAEGGQPREKLVGNLQGEGGDSCQQDKGRYGFSAGGRRVEAVLSYKCVPCVLHATYIICIYVHTNHHTTVCTCMHQRHINYQQMCAESHHRVVPCVRNLALPCKRTTQWRPGIHNAYRYARIHTHAHMHIAHMK